MYCGCARSGLNLEGSRRERVRDLSTPSPPQGPLKSANYGGLRHADYGGLRHTDYGGLKALGSSFSTPRGRVRVVASEPVGGSRGESEWGAAANTPAPLFATAEDSAYLNGWGLGFGVWGLAFQVWGLEFRI